MEKENKSKSYFEVLNGINVNGHVEKKNNLSYLSWSWAWSEVLKIYPDAEYYIERFGEPGHETPYLYDENLGYMVFTRVRIDGHEKEMWLPVMDNVNKPMKAQPYTYSTYKGDKTVEAATMFDINKTIMRCLVKNLAMFGLGMYIYSGEDLPEEMNPKFEKITDEQITKIKELVEDIPAMLNYYKVKVIEDMLKVDAEALIKRKSKK